MELDLQGNIERFTLPEIFQLIATGRKSGTLGIQKDDSIVMIYFREGDIIYGYGPRQTFHVGQLLKDHGLITTEQLNDAVRIQSDSQNSKRLGEILIQQRYIDRADLEKVISRQIEELLYSLLSWQAGTFKFYENKFPTDEEITVRISVENVILEGLRRSDERSMIHETLPDLKAVFTISASQSGRTREISMQAEEWNLMALVDGSRSLEEICHLSKLDRNRTLLTLAKLKLAGIITKTEAKSTPPDDSLEMMIERLAGLFENYLNARSVDRQATRQVTSTIAESAD